MSAQAVDIMVPADLADILIAEGAARSAYERRSEIARIIAEGASAASVTIALLQGPSVVTQAARGIKRWVCERQPAASGPARLIFEFRGERVEFVVDSETDVALIAGMSPRPP
jgi:hypothetical protein